MLPQAQIVHQLRGRLRLKIREKRQDPEYFTNLCSRIEALGEVMEVSANPTTGSVLLLHPELPYERLEPQLAALELFEIVAAPPPRQSALIPVFDGVARLDKGLSTGTSGNFDLRTLAVIGLLGVAVHQLYRGNIVGPAIPMLMSALDLARQIPVAKADDTDPEE
jgi:hypothetical protein